MKTKLAIVSTHPIQYYAPVFRQLAASARVTPKVFYSWSQTASGALADRHFGRQVSWDVPLLDGYDYEFVENVAREPGLHHFAGIDNPDLERRIRRWEPDALLVYGWNLRSHLRLLRSMKGRVPVYFRGDSTLLDPRPPLRRVARRLWLGWVYRHIDWAIAVGQNSADYFAWCGVPRTRIAIAPHSVDTRRFEHSESADEQAAAWRAELGIDPGEPVVLSAGKLYAVKAIDLLIDAFQNLSTPAHLVIVGNGELEQQLKARAASQPRIHFLGFQNQSRMPTVYRLGDVFVLPSRSETWGLALNEAMASGRPCIASTRVGGARDLIRPGSNGWVFESGQVQALTGTLDTALALGRKGLHAMGGEARRFIDGWSTQAAAARIEQIVSAGAA